MIYILKLEFVETFTISDILNFIVLLVIFFTLIEMKIQRKSSQKSTIFLTSKQYFKNKVDSNNEWIDILDENFTKIKISNIGTISCHSLRFDYTFDDSKLIELYNKLGIDYSITKTKNSPSVFRRKDSYLVIGSDLNNNEDYLLPNENKMIKLPHIYTIAFFDIIKDNISKDSVLNLISDFPKLYIKFTYKSEYGIEKESFYSLNYELVSMKVKNSEVKGYTRLETLSE